MSEAREQFARQLEEAADNIRDVPKHELQILLRRAAFDFATCLSSPKKNERRSRMMTALERLEGKQKIIRMINYEQPHPLTIGANHSIFALDMAGPSAPRCTGRSSYLACA